MLLNADQTGKSMQNLVNLVVESVQASQKIRMNKNKIMVKSSWLEQPSRTRLRQVNVKFETF